MPNGLHCLIYEKSYMTIIVRSLEGYSTDVWANLPWRLFEKRLVRLQRRIHKASKRKNKKLVKDLQNLLLNSNSARYLALRYAIETSLVSNEFSKTDFKVLTSKQKILLVNELKHPRISPSIGFTTLFNPSLKYYIYKLKIASLQCLFNYTIEPVSELASLYYFYKGQFINPFQYSSTRLHIVRFIHSLFSDERVVLSKSHAFSSKSTFSLGIQKSFISNFIMKSVVDSIHHLLFYNDAFLDSYLHIGSKKKWGFFSKAKETLQSIIRFLSNIDFFSSKVIKTLGRLIQGAHFHHCYSNNKFNYSIASDSALEIKERFLKNNFREITKSSNLSIEDRLRKMIFIYFRKHYYFFFVQGSFIK